MNRRKFLGQAAALLTAPLWIRRAFAGSGEDDCEKAAPAEKGVAAVATAYRKAERAGKPLLVLIIPRGSADKYRRGHLFGSYLNHATDAQLAPMALAEVVCAKPRDLRAIVPDALGVRWGAQPALVLVETDAVPARVTAFELPEVPELRDDGRDWDEEEAWAARQKRELALADARIDAIARLVREVLVPDRAAADRRAEQNARRLPPGAADRAIGEIAAGRSLTPRDADQAAGVLGRLAFGGLPPDQAAPYAEVLARAAARRLRDAPPRGARWAYAGGCGMSIEGEQDEGMVIACGMGHVPPKSGRFLFLFARGADYWRDREDDE